jgi:hypothetical protein
MATAINKVTLALKVQKSQPPFIMENGSLEILMFL